MPHHYLLRIFRVVQPDDVGSSGARSGTINRNHEEIATYDLETSPWVPPQGSLFRFRDPVGVERVTPAERARREVNHLEVVGYVDQIVTVFYGTRTTIEIYLSDKKAA